MGKIRPTPLEKRIVELGTSRRGSRRNARSVWLISSVERSNKGINGGGDSRRNRTEQNIIRKTIELSLTKIWALRSFWKRLIFRTWGRRNPFENCLVFTQSRDPPTLQRSQLLSTLHRQSAVCHRINLQDACRRRHG